MYIDKIYNIYYLFTYRFIDYIYRAEEKIVGDVSYYMQF